MEGGEAGAIEKGERGVWAGGAGAKDSRDAHDASLPPGVLHLAGREALCGSVISGLWRR